MPNRRLPENKNRRPNMRVFSTGHIEALERENREQRAELARLEQENEKLRKYAAHCVRRIKELRRRLRDEAAV